MTGLILQVSLEEGVGSSIDIELRALCLLGRHSIIYTTPPALLAFVIFEIGSGFILPCLDLGPPICASLCSWDDRHVPLHPGNC
jgi:hypothetical protein